MFSKARSLKVKRFVFFVFQVRSQILRPPLSGPLLHICFIFNIHIQILMPRWNPCCIVSIILKLYKMYFLNNSVCLYYDVKYLKFCPNAPPVRILQYFETNDFYITKLTLEIKHWNFQNISSSVLTTVIHLSSMYWSIW